MRVNLQSLGCRLNEAELESWAHRFQTEGHQIVRNAGEADLIVLNSCAVTGDATKKSRYLIRRIHRNNPRAKLIVTGCYATLNSQEVAESLGVDLVISNADKANLIDIAKERLGLETVLRFSADPVEASLFTLGRQRAFVKVQDGCRYRCTFCIVTVARGEEKSRPVVDIVDEINVLYDQGVQEVVLTGVHLGGYGCELGLRLEHLINAVLKQTPMPRLRLGSLEPWDLSDGFIDLLTHPRCMPHLHLPLQSGSDRVLRRMARRCRTADYARLIERIRGRIPDMNITTDIIVGFPAETDEEWRQSLQFIDTMHFGHIHIFNYSAREGTQAAGLPNQVADETKKTRSRVLHELAEHHKHQTFTRFLNRTFPILWENERDIDTHGNCSVFGYTSNFLRVEALAHPGRKLSSRIEAATLRSVAPSGDHVIGELTTD